MTKNSQLRDTYTTRVVATHAYIVSQPVVLVLAYTSYKWEEKPQKEENHQKKYHQKQNYSHSKSLIWAWPCNLYTQIEYNVMPTSVWGSSYAAF